MNRFYRWLKEFLLACSLFLLVVICESLFGFAPDVNQWLEDRQNRSS